MKKLLVGTLVVSLIVSLFFNWLFIEMHYDTVERMIKQCQAIILADPGCHYE